MSAVNQITIAGFAGRIAQLITKYLLNNYPEVKINGIARNISKIPNDVRSASNVTIFEADAFNKGGLLKALRGSQVAICAYLGDNTLMVDGQKFLIDACVEAGVPRYIASDWTCDYRDLVPGDMPFKDPMKAIYEYLKQKEGVEGVHMLTGAFIEVVFLRLFADEAHTKIQYFGSGDEGTDLSTMPDSAAWTAEVAVDPKAVGVINGE
jgi:nucleoside-diphosphate-sugar epimerase